MGLIERLIEHVDLSPKIVTGALVGIIAVGGVGGGVWINALNSEISSLQSELKRRDLMEEKRVLLAKDEVRQDMKRLQISNDALSKRIQALEAKVKNLRDQAGMVSAKLQPLEEKSEFNSADIESIHRALDVLASLDSHGPKFR